MDESSKRILNLNVGVLGHVDCGKTSICKALSQSVSTAALDKSPESQARGITIDLGFSSFLVMEESVLFPLFHGIASGRAGVRVTLVDCPGHASLVRTVLGAAHILDACLLVVDATKGFQAQTAECLVIAEIFKPNLIVLLNKTDQLEVATKEALIKQKTLQIRNFLEKTSFGRNIPVVPFSALNTNKSETLEPVVLALALSTKDVRREGIKSPLLFSFDHAFKIRGHGTVLTGTVIRGQVQTGDCVDVQGLGLHKVRGIEVFRQKVPGATQGDRAALCFSGVDAEKLERGFLTAKEAPLLQAHSALVSVCFIRHFRLSIASRSKFHVTVGHDTVMAQVFFFRPDVSPFEFVEKAIGGRLLNFANEVSGQAEGAVLCLLRFEMPIRCPVDSLFVASRLDLDASARACRLAFHGRVLRTGGASQPLKVSMWKEKERLGVLERVLEWQCAGKALEFVAKGLVRKGCDVTRLVGLKARLLRGGAECSVVGGFGSTGRVRVRFERPISVSEHELRAKNSDLKNKEMFEISVISREYLELS